jgi:hypothetical protein
MKPQILKILSLVGKGVAFVIGLPFIASNPAGWAAGLYVVSSAIKDVVNLVGDYVDNDKADGSFKA